MPSRNPVSNLLSIMAVIFSIVSIPVTADAKFIYLDQWGRGGQGQGEFSWPCDLDIDSGGNIYVTDLGNNRVQKFNSKGDFTGGWGSSGSEKGQFSSPCGIDVARDAIVFVADTGNDRIQKFITDGRWQGTPGYFGVFQGPNDVIIDRWGEYLLVADTLNDRIEKYDFGWNKLVGGFGNGIWELVAPSSVTIDSNNFVYVADRGNGRIQIFDSGGRYKASISEWGPVNGRDRLRAPTGVAVDGSGSIYVSDASDRVIRFSSDGHFIEALGDRLKPGSGQTQFNDPGGLALDSQGNLYVADSGNDRIVKFKVLEDQLSQPEISKPKPVDASPLPKRTLKLRILSIDISRKGIVKARLVCEGTEPCKGVLKLRSTGKRCRSTGKTIGKKERSCHALKLSQGRFSVAASGDGKAVFRLSKKVRRWMGRWAQTHKKLKLVASARMKNKVTGSLTVRQNFTMKKM